MIRTRRTSSIALPTGDILSPMPRTILRAIALLVLVFFATSGSSYGRSIASKVQETVVLPAAPAQKSATPSTAPTGPALYPVVKVVDGDTIEVEKDGGIVKVRLIGINTPEVVDPRRPVQCFGTEASAEAHRVLDGQSVSLESDPSQDTYDKYGRLLAYAFLPDGTLFNEHMITAGFAHEYTYDLPYTYQKQFKAAEVTARTEKRGLWAPDTCAGNTTQPAI